MASQESALAGSPPPAQVVGNAFVQQFFHILNQSPELVHRFYQESSKLSRPGTAGEMSTVSSLQIINEKILSMDHSEYRAQIKTVDTQESLNGGVLVLVTGYLNGNDSLRREFVQTFFLATQEKGYYVLNDIFRYVEDTNWQTEEQGFLANETDAPLVHQDDSIASQDHVPDPERTVAVPEENEVNGEVYDSSGLEERSVVDEEVPVDEVINEVPTTLPTEVADSNPTTGREQKKSYASIVRVMRENSAPISHPIKPAPTNTERQLTSASTASLISEVPFANSYATESSNLTESEGDGHSIYIKNLPMNATASQLEEEFKKFGPIKPNGIQVRSNKLQGFCFGFVEFELAAAVQSAIEASPVMIGGRQAYVEEKRATSSRDRDGPSTSRLQVVEPVRNEWTICSHDVPTTIRSKVAFGVNNRGRYALGRGDGFRSIGIRGRGGFGGGRGYGRGDFSNRADFGNRGGSRTGGIFSRGDDAGYHKVDRSRENHHSDKNVAPRVPAPA
ncbi:Nuclear transport factor 2 [Apostasia shenzhenica]|uniref:Nuclear transport factor 2 n=1 Tax=Apostasia shenzhenica TaxID=1088818 RepID=A0A2I0AFZ0_9ASPA|nr:Nuclear transport factor 2 [Apostasia shenzhenica]